MTITETELSVIARLAIIGLKQKPEKRIKNPRRDRHAQRVIEERKREVLADVRHRRPAQPPGADNPFQVAFDKRHAGTLHRDIGAGAHGDADIGLRQRRRIVDAVAGHGDDTSLGLKALDLLRLLIGKHFRAHLVEPQPPRHGFGRRTIVAREHDDPKALFPQIGDGHRCRVLDRIGNAEQTGRPAIDRNENNRLAIAVQGLRTLAERLRSNPKSLEQRSIPDQPPTARRLSLRPPCRCVSETTRPS